MRAAGCELPGSVPAGRRLGRQDSARGWRDRIWSAARPGDRPASINLTTAKALGLTIPESFLLRADEVIEW